MNTKKCIAVGVAFSFAGVLAAPALQAGSLADDLHNEHQQAADMAREAGREALDAARQAIAPVIYAGKAIINGVEFILLKTAEGTIMVTEAVVRGLEYAVEGAKFLALKTAEGIVWVAEKMVRAGEIVFDVISDAVEVIVDGVIYVAAKIEAGIVFVTKEAWKLAKETGKLVVKGVKFVAKQTKKGMIFIAKGVKHAAMRARRGALIAELRTNLAGSLAAGRVGDRTVTYFQRRAGDRDPIVARLARACLAAAQAFNNLY
jgi:hypothetical protein